ncbi:hypothetical protein VFPBJ_10658 [Purpureocillium lilacinum]|uniref:Uncharacterized protein n=1 Tax=Purpureocillium lilacinum TaxID=33203 RepID=A0A179FW27_PURLI|nr:hypothetical protein VFPBJ_10658 [Purpureocillium lilacinum]
MFIWLCRRSADSIKAETRHRPANLGAEMVRLAKPWVFHRPIDSTCSWAPIVALIAASTKGFGEFTFARGACRYNQSHYARAFRHSLGRSDVALSARLADRRSRPPGQDCPSTTWDYAILASFAARLRSDNICSTCCPDNTGASSLTGRLLTATFGPRYAPRLWLPQPTTFFWGLKRPRTLCASSRCLDRPLQHLLPRDNFSSSATSVAARAIAGLCKYYNNR